MLLAADVSSDLETQAVDVVAAQVAADHVDLQGSAALAGDVNGDNLLQPIDVLLIINAVSADGQMALMAGDPMDVNVDGWLTLDDASLAMAHLAATLSTPSGSPQPTVEPQPYDYDWSDPLNTFASSASSSMEPSASPSISFDPGSDTDPTPSPSNGPMPSPSSGPTPSPSCNCNGFTPTITRGNLAEVTASPRLDYSFDSIPLSSVRYVGYDVSWFAATKTYWVKLGDYQGNRDCGKVHTIGWDLGFTQEKTTGVSLDGSVEVELPFRIPIGALSLPARVYLGVTRNASNGPEVDLKPNAIVVEQAECRCYDASLYVKKVEIGKVQGQHNFVYTDGFPITTGPEPIDTAATWTVGTFVYTGDWQILVTERCCVPSPPVPVP